jgi:threonine aldolase
VSVSDFRSDTVTVPSAAMRAAMAAAEVGDDVLDGDPTVRRLEERAAAWLGKEGALFVPSGTMANQVALGASTRPGDEMIVERSAHAVCWEGGAAAAFHGVQTVTLHAEDGALDLDEIRAVVRIDTVHCPRTALIATEQTFMGSGRAAGGVVVPLAHLEAVRALALEHGLAVHMDGARLANAVVAAGVPAARWAGTADSVSVCFSKGLGAPVGSIVAGDAAFLERGRVVRKRLGGWMRQAGVVAAGALYALEHNVERLAEDHALARALAEVLDAVPGITCPPSEVTTNIVMARLARDDLDAETLARALAEHGVRALPQSPRCLRFVTHRDVGPADVERVARGVRRQSLSSTFTPPANVEESE